MKTRIRDSYTPKLGDYCNTLVVDKETGNQYLFDADGVWTLISTDEEGIVEEAVAQANAYTDDVAEGKVDKEEGKGLSENDFTDADKDKLDGIEAGAQENVIEVVKRNGAALPVVNKTVDVEVPTATSALTNDSGYITNAVDDLVNYYDKDETDTLIATEAEARDAADLDLQEQIDAISSASDVVDVVGTYAELQNYDTSKLGDNDIIKVLTDETHDDAISYYRWNDTTETFTYIGSQGPFYTKSETDATFVPQTRTINGKGLNSDVVLTAADVNALPASTVIPTVNDATLTIKKNGTTVTTFTANSAQNATADISVPTKVSDLTNDLDFVEESNLAPVALSGAYADLTGKPSIPTKTSDLTNDSDFVSDANYVHTDNNFTTTEKNKLNGIATGAEVNVQSDWNVTDTSSDAFIKNKPTIPTKTSDLTNDSGFITSAAVPTKTSDLTNDSGFITKNVSDLTNYYTETEVNGMFNALVIPTKTSDLVNDSGFLTSLPIASATVLGGVKIGSGINVAADGTISAAVASLDWANITNKPTDVSYWTNDAGYITSAALPTKTSDLTNDSGFITSASVPTKTSDLTNDSGFITSSVNNLTNYYTKSQTYTQSEVNSLLNAIVVPTKTSDLTNDGANGTSPYVESDDLAAVATSGSYNDLSDKPDIMTGLTEMSYGESNAWAKFLAAYQAKQIVYCRASSNANPASGSQTRKAFMAYVNNAENPTNVEFQYVRSVSTKTASQPVDQVFIYTLDSRNGGTWTVTSRNMGPKLAQGTNTTVSYSNGTYTISATQPTVPTKTSDLANDGSDGTSTYVEANELATVATTGDYDDLTNKPTIPTVNNATLTIQRNSTNVATFTANAASNVTANITVPTATSDLTNDSGFLTSSTLPVATANSLGVVQVGSGLTVSSGGVLSATGGGVADSVAWGHVTGTLADQTDLADALAAKANSADLATVATSGSYNDLTDTPTIPSGVTLYTSLGENTDGALTQKATRELFYNDSAKSKMKIGSLGFSSDTFGSHSTSVGDLSRAAAVESTALGYNARTSGDYSIAIGSSAAIGNRSRASVIGYMSSARAVDAVALGSYALATRANEVNIGTAMGGSGYDNTQTRLLGGLHAGLLDTDAVNVGQLNSALDDKADVSDLATKQNLLSPGNHIDITSDVISATGYVHSENPQAAAAASSTITGSMIANGTITADKLASDATVKLTMSTSDIGEGAPLAANTLYGVYR